MRRQEILRDIPVYQRYKLNEMLKLQNEHGWLHLGFDFFPPQKYFFILGLLGYNPNNFLLFIIVSFSDKI